MSSVDAWCTMEAARWPDLVARSGGKSGDHPTNVPTCSAASAGPPPPPTAASRSARRPASRRPLPATSLAGRVPDAYLVKISVARLWGG